jgi:mono/diheme cytochrome c family protein
MLRIGSVESLRGTGLAVACIALLSGCGRQAPGPGNEAASNAGATAVTAQSQVERGKYLVTIAGCNDCHTPLVMGPEGPRPDMSRLLSGHPESLKMPPAPALTEPWIVAASGTLTAFTGPWGTTYAPNLTPDTNTGIGIWTEEMFVNALKQGKHMGTSREIQPPMPWRWYSHMTDEDLKAMFAYLRTIPPITNHVPDWEPPGGAGN